MATDKNKPELTELEKQQLLNMSMDDMEDLPEFVNPPNGTYMCLLGKRELKKVGDNPSLSINFKIDSLVEAANPEAEDLPKQGDIMSMLFNLRSEYGRGNLKKLFKALELTHGVRDVNDLLKVQEDAIMIACTIRRTHDEDKDRYYTNPVSFVVAG